MCEYIPLTAIDVLQIKILNLEEGGAFTVSSAEEMLDAVSAS